VNARQRRSLGLMATLGALGTAGLFDRAGERLSGQEPLSSPCSVTGTLTVTPKLACPFEPVGLQLGIQATCPDEGGGRVLVRSMDVSLPLPGGLLPADPAAGAAASGDALAAWRVDDFPAAGVTLTQAVRPFRPGIYDLGADVRVRLVDNRGRAAVRLFKPGDPALAVPGPCRGGPAPAYLPVVHRPSCVPSRQAADIVLLVDRSASIGAAGLEGAGQRARAFFDELDLARDRVAVIAFDQRLELRAPLGSDRETLVRALDNLTLGLGTSIDRAIEAGVSHLAAAPGAGGRRRILVLFTDGVQTGPRGEAHVIAAADRARAQGIAILTVAMGAAPNHALLDRISTPSGRLLAAPTARDLDRAFRDLAEVAACVAGA